MRYIVQPEWHCQVGNLAGIYEDTFGYREQGHFVEVGAYDGVSWSATRILALLGWTGIYIEPVPEFAERCRANCARLPNITVIEGCCGAYDGFVTCYFNSSMTTTSLRQIEILSSLPWARCSANYPFEAPMRRLETILSTRDWPQEYDLLVVDTEGTETDVLAGANLAVWQPRLAIVEACEKRSDGLERNASRINQLMAGYGYEPIQVEPINTVYRLKK